MATVEKRPHATFAQCSVSIDVTIVAWPCGWRSMWPLWPSELEPHMSSLPDAVTKAV